MKLEIEAGELAKGQVTTIYKDDLKITIYRYIHPKKKEAKP